MKLSVHLVTWNGEKYIPHLFDSLKKQTLSAKSGSTSVGDWKLVVLDNGSSDKTTEKIEKELEDFSVEYEFIKGKENLGFAGGHNKLFLDYGLPACRQARQTADYVLLLNQDMVLEPDCFEKLVKFMDQPTMIDVGSISPRLMRWDFENKKFSDKIDSLGLKVFRNRRVVEQYTGKDWKELKKEPLFKSEGLLVFGISGALPMYRSKALQEVAFSDGTIFDSLYNSYKEDVDLAFRLKSADWGSFVLLNTAAYHDRSAEGLEEKGDTFAAKNKKRQSEWVRYHSYKNHLMTIYKNEYWQNLLLDSVFIKWYECKKFFWFLLFNRAVLKGLGEIWKNRKDLKRKRKEIKAKRKIGWRGMRVWFK